MDEDQEEYRRGWEAALAAVDRASAEEAAAMQVHAAWLDGMRWQHREVAADRWRWDTLAWRDRVLDAFIAAKLAHWSTRTVRAQEQEERRHGGSTQTGTC